MFDISLYGHITLDLIYEDQMMNTSIGSIGNLFFTLKKFYPNLRINLQPTEFGQAKIFIDKLNSSRSSEAKLSLYFRKPELYQSKWHHILYINELKKPGFIKKIQTGITSTDFCHGKIIKNIEILKYFDFVFISDEDVFMSLKKMSRMVKRGLIMHHSSGSEYYEKGEMIFKKKIKKIKNVNVLGCGDMFASFFILNFLKSKNVRKSIDIAHKEITKILVNLNKI